MIQDRHRHRRCRSEAIVLGDEAVDSVASQNFQHALLARFRERVGVPSDIDRSTDSTGSSVFNNGLGDC